MNEKRREIIVREIEYWKRSRLLPEHYCDYLLALYTEGEVTPSVAPRRKRWATVFVMFLVCLLLPAGVLVIYFTELSFVLQMLLLAFFVGICLIGIWRWRREAVVHLPLISGAFLLFLAMVRMSDYYFPGSKMVLSLVVFLNCFLWVIVGIRFRFLYLTISGAIGLMLLLASFFF
ncbi:MAG: hypothetical protein K6T72_02420 [Anoxybacillus sp.]|nr:hypothetical protein [Anoxybacillus sp.]MCL6585368.1 hypothetical protein [Anoxybacillus sp.]